MYARFFIENKETIGLILIIVYIALFVLAILDLVLSKIQEHKIVKRKARIEIENRIRQERRKVVSQQIRKVMTSEI